MRFITLHRLLSVLNGRHIIQSAMRSHMIIVLPPQVNLRSGFLHGPEPATIQAFVSELAVQAFHKRILGRLSRLDKAQAYSGFLAPEEHGLAGTLGAVITDDLLGLPRASLS